MTFYHGGEVPPTFYHYTCDHGRAALGDRATLKPYPVRFPASESSAWRTGFVWLTDLATPMREALGLTSNFLACDRTRFRYRVEDSSTVRPWTKVARDVDRRERELLEASPGARPKHWFVSTLPVPVVYDPPGGRAVIV